MANIKAKKQGEWLETIDGYPYCSKCGYEPMENFYTRTCPNCGSDNRQRGEEK